MVDPTRIGVVHRLPDGFAVTAPHGDEGIENRIRWRQLGVEYMDDQGNTIQVLLRARGPAPELAFEDEEAVEEMYQHLERALQGHVK